MIRLALALSSASLVATLTLIAQGERGRGGPQQLNSKIEAVATLSTPGTTENIGEAPDGSILITGVTDRILWRVNRDGTVENFFSLPSATAFVGVATDGDEIVLGAFQRPFQRPGGGPPDMSNVGSQILVLDKTGKLKATINGQTGQFFNGLARAGDGWYLIADTNGTALLRVDTHRNTIEPWLQDDLLARMNGIKVHNGWVYVGAGGDKLYRVQIDSNGKPKGPLMIFAYTRADDFAMAPDGTVYVPGAASILKITSTGETSQLLDGGVPATPSAVVTRDGKWLYFATRAGPARVLRVPLE